MPNMERNCAIDENVTSTDCNKQKTESLTSKESSEIVRISSVDTAYPEGGDLLIEDSNKTRSYCLQDNYDRSSSTLQVGSAFNECQSFHREQELSERTTKIDHCGFDLNMGMEANEVKWPSCRATRVSEPIIVVAKVGVPIGIPRTPLQFEGEHGWRRNAATSAFHPAYLLKSDIHDETHYNHKGIDLNIAAELALDLSMEVGSKQTGSDNGHSKPVKILGFDLNNDPSNEEVCKEVQNLSQSSQTSRSCISIDNATSSECGVTQANSGFVRPVYWVDLTSIHGFNHVQAQPILVPFHTIGPIQKVVPLQSEMTIVPSTPSGFYISKINNLSSAIYAPAIIPLAGWNRTSGSEFSGALHVLERGQGLTSSAFANVRPSFSSNHGLTSTERMSVRETSVTARSILTQSRMKPMPQVASPPASIKRREPDGGWDFSQLNCRQLASWD